MMVATTRIQRRYDHRLRELVRSTGDTVSTIRKLVAFYVEEHNTRLPHSAFRGQTPDEMYFETGNDIPGRLETARKAAREERIEGNRKISCPACEPLTAITSRPTTNKSEASQPEANL